MSEVYFKREQEKVKELANEYRLKGFEVIVDPSPNDLPLFLRNTNYKPDIIARSEYENLIIEVKSSKTISDAKNLQQISALVNNHEGWDFIFVLTNPKKPEESESQAYLNEKEDIILGFSKLKELIYLNHQFHDIAFIYLWILIEAILRYGLYLSGIEVKTIDLRSLIRNSQVIGIISKTDHNIFLNYIEKRNLIVHGSLKVGITKNETITLMNISRRIFDEIVRDYSEEFQENYISYLKGLSEDELEAHIDSIVGEMTYELENEDSVSSSIASTNAFGWYCDDYHIDAIDILEDKIIIKISFHMTGDQDPDRAFHGNDINGIAELVITEEEDKYFQNVWAARDTYDEDDY